MQSLTIGGLEIRGPMKPGYEEILTPEACRFVAGLVEKFQPRRAELLAKRAERQRAIDAGQFLQRADYNRPSRHYSFC